MVCCKIGFDKAKNESCKVCPLKASNSLQHVDTSAAFVPLILRLLCALSSDICKRLDPDHPRLARPSGAAEGRKGRPKPSTGSLIGPKCCSFSAVSAPIFARKYAFCSIFRNLQDYQAEVFEIWLFFSNVATYAKFKFC